MKFRSLIAALVFGLASLSAFATGANFTFTNGVTAFNQASSPALPASGQFSQTITFDGLAAGTYDVFGSVSRTNLNVSSVTLNGALWTLYPQLPGQYRFGSIELTGQSSLMTMTISGTTSQAQPYYLPGYNGTLTATRIASPVPEPFSYAMLLAGLGLVGSVVGRRRKFGPT